MRSVVHRLLKLERGAAVGENCILVIVRAAGMDDPATAADITAMKEAGFLRGAPTRLIDIRDSGQIKGLTEQEQQFLAERRKRR